jgi:predicted dehydrogenase
MSQPFRWGILSTGGIAKKFVRDLAHLSDPSSHQVIAVGSRSQASADAFADLFAIPHRHASYQDLVNDPDVDGIYVATHHPMHRRDAELAMNAGKAVLCEKPFAMNYADSLAMVECAKKNNVLLMEAMWTRFLPHILRIREIIASGVLGEIISVRADHGRYFPLDAEFRLFKPELGGGALFDLGIYPVSFAHMVLGSPTSITAKARKAFTGVDGQTSIIMEFESGAHALLSTSNMGATPKRAIIAGANARIEIDRTFYAPSTFRVIDNQDNIIDGWDKEYVGLGLREEADEFARAFRAGEKESPKMTHADTLSVMKSMEEITKQIGLVYPEFIM